MIEDMFPIMQMCLRVLKHLFDQQAMNNVNISLYFILKRLFCGSYTITANGNASVDEFLEKWRKMGRTYAHCIS